MMLAGGLMTFSACSDDEWAAGPAVEGEGVYFSASQSTEITVDDPDGTITLDVYRTNVGGDSQADLTVTLGEGAQGLFDVPTTVSFANGENKTTLTVSYQNLERDVPYSVTLAFTDGTPYAPSSQTFTITCPLVWNTVSEQAVLIDNMFSPFGAANIQISEIVVEKHPDQNIYRFKSPYDNSYFEYVFGATVYEDDFEAPYIVLDGESYPEYGYFIAGTALGFRMVNGEGPTADAEWNTFGSVAGNTSTPVGDPSAPIATFNEAGQYFDFGSVYHNIDGVGAYPVSGFYLFLDPSLM